MQIQIQPTPPAIISKRLLIKISQPINNMKTGQITFNKKTIKILYLTRQSSLSRIIISCKALAMKKRTSLDQKIRITLLIMPIHHPITFKHQPTERIIRSLIQTILKEWMNMKTSNSLVSFLLKNILSQRHSVKGFNINKNSFDEFMNCNGIYYIFSLIIFNYNFKRIH